MCFPLFCCISIIKSAMVYFTFLKFNTLSYF